ncbi:hypothetical protein BH10ACT10_BH10ACT10_02230 [soil metagenome]
MLGRLVDEFHVPDGFVLTTRVHGLLLRRAGLTGREPEHVQSAALAATPWPENLVDAVTSAVATLGDNALVVRSSAVAEDGTDRSFAGRFRSVLDVSGTELHRTVSHCLAAGAPNAQERDDPPAILALLVQRLVVATWSGVMFTSDTVTGDESQLLIEAVPGTPEQLCAGLVAPHRVTVDKVTRQIRHRSGPSGSVPGEDVIDAVMELGLRLEARLGARQDVEWATDGDRLYVLQARPITVGPPRRSDPPSLIDSLGAL